MGRAKNTEVLVSDSFSQVFGSNRGAVKPAGIASFQPSLADRAELDQLKKEIVQGNITPAIETLSSYWKTYQNSPLLVELSQALGRHFSQIALTRYNSFGPNFIKQSGIQLSTHPIQAYSELNKLWDKAGLEAVKASIASKEQREETWSVHAAKQADKAFAEFLTGNVMNKPEENLKSVLGKLGYEDARREMGLQEIAHLLTEDDWHSAIVQRVGDAQARMKNKSRGSSELPVSLGPFLLPRMRRALADSKVAA